MKKLKVCRKCSLYTLEPACPGCGERTASPHPPKFSPADKYGKYRRMLKSRRSEA
jgi:H/ACA ribonucleoprotein complex subunit 3